MLDDWWTYGSSSSDIRNNEIIESCSNTDAANCFSFCPGNIEIITTSVTDDYFGEQRDTVLSHCIANLPGSCGYRYWLIFKLVPLLIHVFVLFLQCWCLYVYAEFTPQAIQYGIFPFMEFAVAVYVWGELFYPSTNCNNVAPLSFYYYPILMTVFDMCKFNLYNSNQYWKRNEYVNALSASLDLYSFCFYTVLSVLLGLYFIYSMMRLICVQIYQLSWYERAQTDTDVDKDIVQSLINKSADNISTHSDI